MYDERTQNYDPEMHEECPLHFSPTKSFHVQTVAYSC